MSYPISYDLRIYEMQPKLYAMIDGELKEVSEYINNQHGLKRVNTLEQTLDTGIHRYLLIAVNTSSLITRIKHSTVIINT